MNRDVVESVATFLGISVEELLERHDSYLQHQLERWHRLSPDSAAKLADYYNDNLYIYELISAPRFGLVRLVEPFLQPESAILDYGSGIGTHGLHFLRGGHRVTFVDLPSPHFNYVRWQCARSNLAATFVETAAAGSLPADSLDAILCFDVLEHVLDWRETIERFARLLKADGKLFLIVSFLKFEEEAIHISSRTGLTEEAFRECMKRNGLVEIFHRDRPVPLSHPLEPLRVFARTASENAARASKSFKDGETHLRAGEMAEAERCFTEAIAWNPQDFSAHRALAEISLRQGKLVQAAAETSKVLELLPEDIGALELSADLCMATGDRPGAARHYADAIASWREHAAHSKQKLDSLLKEGFPFELACDHFDDWRKLQSLLSYLIETENFTQAEGLARRLTATHRQESYAGYLIWKEYARLLRQTDRSADAIGVLEQLISHHPDRLWLHFDIALCHASQRRFADALSELGKEECLSPFRATILFEKGLVYRRQGDLSKARDLFGEVAELAPENGSAFLERARIALQLGDPAAALPDLTEAARLMPENGQVLLERGRTALRLGDHASALSDLRLATALLPDNAQAHFELGQLELWSKSYWKAIESFDAAYRLDPERMWPNFSRNMKMILTARGWISRLREYRPSAPPERGKR